MGTHPIFESDFDCLTDGAMKDYSHLPDHFPPSCKYTQAKLAAMSDDEVRRLYKVERDEFHRDPDKTLNRLHRGYMRREVQKRGFDSDLSSIDTDAENEYRARNGMS